MNTRELIPTSAAAALAGVHAVTIAAWAKKGKLYSEPAGRGIVVDRAQVLALKKYGRGAEPELDRAKAIVQGEAEVSREELEAGDEPETPVYLEGLDEDGQQDFKVRMARRLVDHAVQMRNRRQKEAERELLWLAVQELGLAEAEGPRKRVAPEEEVF